MIEILINVPVSIMHRESENLKLRFSPYNLIRKREKRENRFINNTGVYEMARGKNQHVVTHNGDWAVKGAGNEKPTVVVPTQKEAIAIAEEIARNQGSDTKIHGRNGRIRAGNSYGNDPFPPRDKK